MDNKYKVTVAYKGFPDPNKDKEILKLTRRSCDAGYCTVDHIRDAHFYYSQKRYAKALYQKLKKAFGRRKEWEVSMWEDVDE